MSVGERPSALGENSPAGPMWLGGELTVGVTDDRGLEYSIQWLPDKNNPGLRRNGKPMYFYFLPPRPRLATNPEGDYKFHLQKFAGVMDPSTNVGAEGYAETAGGYLTFTTTMAPPPEIMQDARQKLKEKVERQYEENDLLRGIWRDDLPEPNFPPITPIKTTTRIHDITTYRNRQRGEGGGSGGGGAGGGGTGGDVPRWGWDVQGEGKGALSMAGTNAFSVMLGSMPVQLIRGAAESGESNIVVEHTYTYGAYTGVASVDIHGEWENIYDHLSASFGHDGLFTAADIQGEFNRMEREGYLTVEVSYNDAFLDKSEANKFTKAADEIANKFLKMARKTILTEEEPNVKAASAEDRFWGNSFALKARRDVETLEQGYSKDVEKMVRRTARPSSSLQGFFDEIQRNEDALDRYFSTVYLDEAFQKVHVIATANANWGSEGEAGDPIERLMIQVGYPDSEGNLVWKNAARYRDSAADTELSTDGIMASWTEESKDRVYVFDFMKHDDVEGRDPDEISVKEVVSFEEHPRVLVDEVERQRTTTDHLPEVRAENAGHLEVNPVDIDQPIPNEQVTVLLDLRTEGVPAETFQFTKGNEKPKYWDVWFPPERELPPWEYKAEVIVEPNTFGLPALRWESDWRKGEGDDLKARIPPAPADKRETLREYLK